MLLLRCWLLALGLFSAGIMCFALVAQQVLSEAFVLVSFFLVIISPFLCGKYAARRSTILVPKHIDKTTMWLNGAGEPFLDSIRNSIAA